MVYLVQNKEDFDKQMATAGEKLVVIDFFANWCGPCKIISPKLEEMAVQYGDKALVLKIDVDECEDIALEYNVTSMPTFIFIKNQQVIDIFVGGNTEKLVKNMEKFVGEPVAGGADDDTEAAAPAAVAGTASATATATATGTAATASAGAAGAGAGAPLVENEREPQTVTTDQVAEL